MPLINKQLLETQTLFEIQNSEIDLSEINFSSHEHTITSSTNGQLKIQFTKNKEKKVSFFFR